MGSPPPDEHNVWCDDPGPAHASWCAALDPDLDDAGWCEVMGVDPERCLDAGSARIVVRAGDKKRTATVPLRIGERQDADLGGGVALQYGGHGPAAVELKLPGVLGSGTTSGTGKPPAVDWSLSGLSRGSTAGCSVHSAADGWGTITGSVRCDEVRTESGRRVRLQIEYRALPLIAGPLPSPAPIPTLPPTPDPDPVCGLLDGPVIAAATDSPGLLLLPAGPGQCVVLSPDVEVAAVFVTDGLVAAPLGDGTAWRGATCVPLPLSDPTAQPLGADCTWPDGRRQVVAAAPAGTVAPVTLVLSLAVPASTVAGDPVPPATIDAVIALLVTAVSRQP
jgi:hypothetical protein